MAFLTVAVLLNVPAANADSDTKKDSVEGKKVTQGKTTSVKIGDKAPDFSLLSGSGETVALKDFNGKKSVVLFFYPKDETSVCTKEACAFRDQFEVFKDLGAEVIGVSSDSVQSHKEFAASHKLPYKLLSDDGGKLRKLYGVPSTMGIIPGRVTYVIDKAGTVKHVFNSQMEGEKHVTEAVAMLKSLQGK
ncbi:MAG: peroxiredoxin [Leptolyngbya sp.]|nr:peroxiredoxin [Candidatus Melainabacteria bacterium]